MITICTFNCITIVNERNDKGEKKLQKLFEVESLFF